MIRSESVWGRCTHAQGFFLTGEGHLVHTHEHTLTHAIKTNKQTKNQYAHEWKFYGKKIRQESKQDLVKPPKWKKVKYDKQQKGEFYCYKENHVYRKHTYEKQENKKDSFV